MPPYTKEVPSIMAEIENSIAQCCKQLRLSTNFAGQALTLEGDTPQKYLLNLLENEISYRIEKRKSKYLNTAGFPRRYRAEEFKTDEIDFPDGISFQSLLDLDFYHAGKNVIMYGGTGTGKTMLLILIGMSACNQEIPVRFYRTAGLINLFSESQGKGTLSTLKKKLNSAQILILDGFGYESYENMTDDEILAAIRQEHLKDSTVTIVLIGSETANRKWIDWEIYSSLRPYGSRSRNGLLGIYLPTAGETPARLQDNIDSGYAVTMEWENISWQLESKIDEAFNNRGKSDLVRNSRKRRERNS